MHLTTKGLVIRTVDWRDGDRLLTALTEDYGLITANAPGVRRRSSKFGGAGQLSLYEKGGRMTVQDAQVLEQFFRLAEDLDALSLASYLCELLGAEGEEGTPSPGALRLALNSLYALANHVAPPALIKAAFELRFLAISGYEPAGRAAALRPLPGRVSGGQSAFEQGFFAGGPLRPSMRFEKAVLLPHPGGGFGAAVSLCRGLLLGQAGAGLSYVGFLSFPSTGRLLLI